MKKLLWFSMTAALLNGCNFSPDALAGKPSNDYYYDNYNNTYPVQDYKTCHYVMKQSSQVTNTGCENPKTLKEVVENVITLNTGKLRIQMLPTKDGKFQEISSITFEQPSSYYSSSTDRRELKCALAPDSDQPGGRKTYYCTLPLKIGDSASDKFKLYQVVLKSEPCWTTFAAAKTDSYCNTTTDTTDLSQGDSTIVPFLYPTDQKRAEFGDEVNYEE